MYMILKLKVYDHPAQNVSTEILRSSYINDFNEDVRSMNYKSGNNGDQRSFTFRSKDPKLSFHITIQSLRGSYISRLRIVYFQQTIVYISEMIVRFLRMAVYSIQRSQTFDRDREPSIEIV